MDYKFRFVFLSLLSMLIMPGHYVSAQSVSYNISVPAGFPKETTKDIIQLLNTATPYQWHVDATHKEVNRGIILRITNQPSFKTKESFRIQTNGLSILTISSSSIDGLEFGIYKYLRSQGFKFYLPGDLYTIIPKSLSLFAPKKDYVDQPFVQIRDFFGTGGFGSGNSDTDKTVEKSWNLWRKRNGFGTAYALAGHRGENFILENNNELLQHPDWLVSPKITNGKIDPGTKLNYLNKEAVEFYTNWSIKPFTKPDFQVPARGVTQFVSMEPSDGGGYLSGINTPSVSDQVFGAANVAASKLDKLFPNNPNIGVNLYAYSSHAEPPSFNLNPRVFVQIIPYQFQNIAFGPSFIQMWASKAKRFGIYDYFKYPDQSYDLPGGMTLKETMQRLIYSINSGSEGTTFESSYSKFSTGIPFWIIARYLADGDSDWNKNLDLLVSDLYQQAKPPIKQMFSLFYNYAVYGTNNLSSSVALLHTATEKTPDPILQQRFTELKEYLFFIHLVFTSRDVSKTSLKDRLLPVSIYAWKIYRSGIIDSYRIMQLISYSFLNMNKNESDYPAHQQLHLDWFPETDKRSAAWSSLPQLSSQTEANKNFQLLQNLYHQSFPNISYSLAQAKAAISKDYKPIHEMNIGGNYTVRSYFSVYCEKPTKIIIIYKLTNPNGMGKVTISGIDNNYKAPVTFSLKKPSGEIEYVLPIGETNFFMNAGDYSTYRFNVKISEGLIFFNSSPRGIVNFYKNFSDDVNQATYDPKYYPSYIYIPKEANSLNYKVQLNGLKFTSPSGLNPISNLLKKEYGGIEIRELKIHRGEAGNIWKAAISGNFNYNMLNIPDRYFLITKN
jgi:hypothetical protein